jgi:hypothetical protein
MFEFYPKMYYKSRVRKRGRLFASRGITNAIDDMLDRCAKVKAGQDVLILAAYDGFYGGTNIVDMEALTWIQAGVEARGAHPNLLVVDVPTKVHEWKIPRAVKAAVQGVDVLINNVADLPWEELYEFRQILEGNSVPMIRNMATSSSLLSSKWAQTPYELVTEIRFRTGEIVQKKQGATWSLTHPNGTNLEGRVEPIRGSFKSYTELRSDTCYRPFPEGVFPPIASSGVNGSLVFDETSPWWARYIGVPYKFEKPVHVTIENSKIKSFDGGSEARAFREFFATLRKLAGEGAYDASSLHGGVNPNARVPPNSCDDPAYASFIEHHNTNSIHLHLGRSEHKPQYPYYLHITAELRGATLKLGDAMLYDRGHLNALDDPNVREIALRYPDRPGL